MNLSVPPLPPQWRCFLNFLRQFPHHAQENGNPPPVVHSLGCVAAMLDRVPVTLRRAGLQTPVHPSTPFAIAGD